MRIGIIDLGIGNFASMSRMFDRLGCIPVRVESPSELPSADRVVLPGVGAFDYAVARLDQAGFRGPLLDLMGANTTPVLGVCVGMQLLAESSAEGPGEGLGWIPAPCRKFSFPTQANLKIPHMGWGEVTPAGADPLLEASRVQRFYFVHSYFLDAGPDHVVATSDYGMQFPAAVRRGLVWGVQFHPEKSHSFGLDLLRRFVDLPC